MNCARVLRARRRTRAGAHTLRTRNRRQRDGPISSHIGDHAIVLADGRMHGFVGGSCSRDIVRRRGCHAHGDPRSRIRPGAPVAPTTPSRHGRRPMSCESEGAVDVYVEPHLPARSARRRRRYAGCRRLARLASALDGYRVIRVVDAPEPARARRIRRGTRGRTRCVPDFLAGNRAGRPRAPRRRRRVARTLRRNRPRSVT